MKIVEKNINEIKPYEKNPRKNDEAVKYVMESIKQFGFKVPIVIDKENVIVCGHTRYKASQKLGIEVVPCVIADDLTDEQIKAFRLADNKVSEKADWDFDLLNDEIDDILNIDMQEFGFDIEVDEEETEIIEDEVPEVQDEPKTKLGDMYRLGNHMLICGDCTDVNVIDRLMGGEKYDMVFTDPPYGNGTSGIYGRSHRTIEGDKDLTTFNDFISIMNCNKIIYFLQWRTLCESIEQIKKKKLKINTVAVWDKKNAGLNGGGGISEQWEAVVFAGDIKYKKFGGNVFTIAREQHRRENSPHPHQKPIKLLEEIFDFIDECKVVLDPFGGSGSTLIACEQLNRKCYMCELDPHYIDVIIQRWENFTGQKAELITSE